MKYIIGIPAALSTVLWLGLQNRNAVLLRQCRPIHGPEACNDCLFVNNKYGLRDSCFELHRLEMSLRENNKKLGLLRAELERVTQ